MSARAAGGALVMLGGVVTGVVLGQRLGPSEAHVALGTGAIVSVLALSLRSRVRVIVGCTGLALLGTASMQRALEGLAHSPLAGPTALRSDVVIAGTLSDDPGGGRYGVQALVRARSVAPLHLPPRAAGGRTLLVTGNAATASQLRLLEAGDRVELAGWLEPLTGRVSRFTWKHAVAHLRVNELHTFSRPGSPMARLANAARAAVLRGNAVLPPGERALVAGFLLGDTRQIPPAVVNDFRAAGLSHLLAVSGANVAFVLAIFAPLLTRLGYRTRIVVGLAVLVVFGTMTRWEPSVLRAIAMAGTAMLGLLLGRPQAGLRLLVVAMAALLLVDPFLLHSVGFLLSCGASGGITLLGPRISRRLRGPPWFREGMGVTLAAQLGVAPVLLPVFGSIPVASLPANLLAVPAAGPLTVWGLVAGSIGGVLRPWWPGAVAVLQVPTVVLSRYIEAVAAAGARFPVVLDGRSVWGVVALASVLLAVARLHRVRSDVQLSPRRRDP